MLFPESVGLTTLASSANSTTETPLNSSLSAPKFVTVQYINVTTTAIITNITTNYTTPIYWSLSIANESQRSTRNQMSSTAESTNKPKSQMMTSQKTSALPEVTTDNDVDVTSPQAKVASNAVLSSIGATPSDRVALTSTIRSTSITKTPRPKLPSSDIKSRRNSTSGSYKSVNGTKFDIVDKTSTVKLHVFSTSPTPPVHNARFTTSVPDKQTLGTHLYSSQYTAGSTTSTSMSTTPKGLENIILTSRSTTPSTTFKTTSFRPTKSQTSEYIKTSGKSTTKAAEEPYDKMTTSHPKVISTNATDVKDTTHISKEYDAINGHLNTTVAPPPQAHVRFIIMITLSVIAGILLVVVIISAYWTRKWRQNKKRKLCNEEEKPIAHLIDLSLNDLNSLRY